MSEPNESEWRTRDLYLAAACVAVGLQLLRTEREPNSGRFLFVFDENDERRQFSQDWFNREGQAGDLREYAEAVQDLKSLVHSWSGR